MKKLFLLIAVLAATMTASASQWDLKNALKSVAGGSTTSTESSSSTASTVGSLLGGLTNLLGKTDVTIADLQGTWAYSKPAVAFKSDNLLKKAGGAAAAGVIEEKITPYYKMAGITSMKLTIEADSTFTMKLNRINLSGNLTKDDDGNFVFNFQAVGKINIGHLTSVITKTGNSIDVTFDATKLITLISKIAQISGNSTLKTASSVLEGYDGLNAGFELTKTSD